MKLFSDTALKYRNKAGEADIIADITSPWMWILLLALTLSMSAVVYWAFFSTLVDSVSGSGVIVRPDGVRWLIANQAGVLEYIDVQSGSPVTANQVVGRIYNAEQFFEIRKLRIVQGALQKRLAKIQEGTERLAEQRKELEEKKNQIISQVVEELKKSRLRTSDLLSMQKQLMGIGASSKVSYYNTLNEGLSQENSMATTLIQKMEGLHGWQEAQWNQEEKQLSLQSEAFMNKQELDLKLKINEDAIWLRSEVSGVVTELLKQPGDPVSKGEPIAVLSVAENSQSLRLVAFVPMAEGKKIRPGMSVYFSPAALRAADYGYIEGVVLSASMYPVSGASINAELKNEDYMRTLVKNGSVMRIEAEFIPDQKSTSGLHWTSSNGLKAAVQAGMVGSILINTEFRTPISYVVPYLRGHFFGIGDKTFSDSTNTDS